MAKSDVEIVKAQLEAQGVNVSTPCGAFKITKGVAERLAHTGAGLLSKPSGNNCDGFAVDIIAYADGRIFDILIDSGGANEPTWDAKGEVDPSRWVPVPPSKGPSEAIPDPPVTNPSGSACKCNLEPLEGSLEGITALLKAIGPKLDMVLVHLDDLDQLGREIKQRQDRAFSGRIFGVNFTLDVRKD